MLTLREVWCERSDGLKVTHGCNPALKPSTSKSCQPPCSVSNSFCDSKIVCSCRKNYIAILGSNGYLIHCFAQSNSFGNDSLNVILAESDSPAKKDNSCKLQDRSALEILWLDSHLSRFCCRYPCKVGVFCRTAGCPAFFDDAAKLNKFSFSASRRFKTHHDLVVSELQNCGQNRNKCESSFRLE